MSRHDQEQGVTSKVRPDLARASRLALSVAILAGLPMTEAVSQDNRPAWGASPRLAEELRIGSLDGADEADSFGMVVGLAVMDNGDIWVADRMAGTIRRFSRDGALLGSVGRPGQGPGEFRFIGDLRVHVNGTVLVWDPGNQRIHVFDQEGSLVRDFRAPVSAIFDGRDLQLIETDFFGDVYVLAPTPPSTSSDYGGIVWIRLSADGEVVDSLRPPPTETVGTYNVTWSRSAISPIGEMVTARNDAYRFEWSLRGGRNVVISREFDPVDYARAERAEAQRFDDLYAERIGRPLRRVPGTKPAWRVFKFDVDGRLWVERFMSGVELTRVASGRATQKDGDMSPASWGQPLVHDVFDLEGRLLGTVAFPNSTAPQGPPRTELLLAKDMSVWVLERGPFDEEYIVQYEIMPGNQ